MTARPAKKATPASFSDRLKSARLPERTVPVCLRADLVADFEELDRRLEAAAKKGATSLAGSGVGPLMEQMDALQAEMEAATETFRLRALPRTKRPDDDRPTWREIVAAHPPRENDQGELVPADRLAGVNMETIGEPLIRASVISPKPSDDEWAVLFAALTDRQFDELVQAAWVLNQGRVDVPFSRAASALRQASAEG